MRAGGPIAFHAEARVADDDLVDGRADGGCFGVAEGVGQRWL
jgi:hypothetical protein